MLFFNTIWALIIGVIFLGLTAFLYGRQRGTFPTNRAEALVTFCMSIGIFGLVMFFMLPNRVEPYLLEDSRNYRITEAFGDSLFAYRSCQDDTTIIINLKKGNVHWPRTLGAADTSLGILHVRMVSAVGFSMIYDWRFVGGQEYDDLFINHKVKIREASLKGLR